MLPTFDIDYIFPGIGYMLVLLVLRNGNVRFWLRASIIFFIPIFISVIPYILFKWDAVPLADGLTFGSDMPGVRYSSFAMAFGYGLGRVLIPCMTISFCYWLIQLARSEG